LNRKGYKKTLPKSRGGYLINLAPAKFYPSNDPSPSSYLPASKRAHLYELEKGYKMKLPTREVYLKGPGMIFKGNPKNYLTGIQLMLED
jgi:hypothetical protein